MNFVQILKSTNCLTLLLRLFNKILCLCLEEDDAGGRDREEEVDSFFLYFIWPF
jgi:hypothetical protein